MAQTQSRSSTPPEATSAPTPAPEVADPPSLAPNIELSGQMEETGFEQQQWLVLRDGAFVQVTELLYRVLEQVDGQQTLDRIAEGVSESYGRKVSIDNIKQLIGTKLMPMGLVCKPDGTKKKTG